MILITLSATALSSMNTSPVNVSDWESHTAELLAAARSLFDAAFTGKTITSADRDQIAYKFQSLLDEYMRDEKPHAIGTFPISIDIHIESFHVA